MVMEIVIAAFMACIIALLFICHRKLSVILEFSGKMVDVDLKMVNSELQVSKNVGTLLNQMESVHCGMERALEEAAKNGEQIAKILEQMDELSNQAALTDTVSQGMNSIMSFSGLIGGDE